MPTPAITIRTSLGDKLLLSSLTYSDQLGRPFRMEAELLSLDAGVDFDKLVGDPVGVTLQIPGGGKRHFHGLVSALSQGAPVGRYASYHATIVPWLWCLTRTADCRIFQDKKIPDIIKEVFKEYGFSDIADHLKRSYKPWTYCVQYRETDFNFVSRLMEQEGIYYYWKHSEKKHELVLVDELTAHEPFPGAAKLAFRPQHTGSEAGEDITAWTVRQQLQPGLYALTDYNFQKPSASLLAKATLSDQRAGRKWEVFDYPGEYDENSEGADYAKLRIQELQAQFEVASASSSSRGIAVGSQFTLEKHPRKDQNRAWLVTSCDYTFADQQYETGDAGSFQIHCSFTAIDAKKQFRSPRVTPKPMVQGPQTAIVAGPKGEEIYVDEFGRVKVQFHWDRYGKRDEKSSCWMRVAQPWAGKKWGMIHIPRIGQEVIVEFLEGDPDQPIITGSVYNDEQKVPYDLPAEKTKSALKSNSSKGGVGFNEIRFEDLKGKEQIFLHAERNMDVRVKNDSMERVIGNRHLITGWENDGAKGGDQREMVYRDQHLKVHRNHVEHIGGDMQLLIGGVDGGEGNQDIILKGVQKQLIEKDAHLHIKGARNQKIDGDQSLEIGGSQQEKIGQKHAVDAGQEIHLKAGMKVIIEAGLQISLKAGGGFIDIGPAGVTISGTMVLINSGGSAGSGSGSSPTAPAEPKEAAPTEPAKADTAKTGQKSAKT